MKDVIDQIASTRKAIEDTERKLKRLRATGKDEFQVKVVLARQGYNDVSVATDSMVRNFIRVQSIRAYEKHVAKLNQEISELAKRLT